jgi:carbamoyl-phosphate synthase large subunit
VPSARAALEAIETKDEPLDVAALSERPTERRQWGVPE